MFNAAKQAIGAGALAATALAGVVGGATTAQARGYGHRGGDDAAIAVGAGLVGLAVGAAIASDHPRYYYAEPAYYGYPAYPAYYGGYYDYPAYYGGYYGYPVYRGGYYHGHYRGHYHHR